MKWDLNYLKKYATPSLEFNEDFNVDEEFLKNLHGVRKINKFNVKGDIKLLSSIDLITINYHINCEIVVGCSLTNEDVNYTINDSEVVEFCLSEENLTDEGILVKDNVIELDDYIKELLIVNIPLSVVKEGAEGKTLKGKSWSFLANEETSDEENIDPRLEKLKNYFTNN